MRSVLCGIVNFVNFVNFVNGAVRKFFLFSGVKTSRRCHWSRESQPLGIFVFVSVGARITDRADESRDHGSRDRSLHLPR